MTNKELEKLWMAYAPTCLTCGWSPAFYEMSDYACPSCGDASIGEARFEFIGNSSIAQFGLECPNCGAWTRSTKKPLSCHEFGDTSYRDEIIKKITANTNRRCTHCSREG